MVGTRDDGKEGRWGGRAGYVSSKFSFIYLVISGCAGSSLLLGLSPAAKSRGFSLAVVHGLLIVAAPLVSEHGL